MGIITSVIVKVNGEIYNHKQLRETLKGHQFQTGSDCEVIAHLYEEHGEEFVDMLDGMFSFVLLDTRDNTFMAARDAIVCFGAGFYEHDSKLTRFGISFLYRNLSVLSTILHG